MYQEFVDALAARVTQIEAGDPMDPDVTMGPLINEAEAERVDQIVKDAASSGGRIVCGAERNRAVLPPRSSPESLLTCASSAKNCSAPLSE